MTSVEARKSRQSQVFPRLQQQQLILYLTSLSLNASPPRPLAATSSHAHKRKNLRAQKTLEFSKPLKHSHVRVEDAIETHKRIWIHRPSTFGWVCSLQDNFKNCSNKSLWKHKTWRYQKYQRCKASVSLLLVAAADEPEHLLSVRRKVKIFLLNKCTSDGQSGNRIITDSGLWVGYECYTMYIIIQKDNTKRLPSWFESNCGTLRSCQKAACSNILVKKTLILRFREISGYFSFFFGGFS